MPTIAIPALYRSLHAYLMQRIPDECESRLTNLIWLMMGIFQARSVQLNLAARKVPIRAKKLRRAQRFALLERAGSDLSLVVQCERLSLNRSGVYDQPVGVSERERGLKRRLDEIDTACPFEGLRRITAALRRAGAVVHHQAVARHMGEMGLVAIFPGPNLSRRAQQQVIQPYRLRQVTVAQPNHGWGIALPYLRLRAGWLYRVTVLDWFSRYGVSGELDQTLDVAFVLAAMRSALRQATPLICNADQGSPFTGPPYIGLLLEAKVQISMDGRGRARDNVLTERLWRFIKDEEVYLHD